MWIKKGRSNRIAEVEPPCSSFPRSTCPLLYHDWEFDCRAYPVVRNLPGLDLIYFLVRRYRRQQVTLESAQAELLMA